MNRTTKVKIRRLTEAGIIAAMYTVLTLISSAFGLSSMAVQCRLSESLCMLPILTPSAIPGVAVGCLISNLITTASIFDIVLGTTASLIGAIGTYLLRGVRFKWIASLPTVIANTIAVPAILMLMGVPNVVWQYVALTVALGEILSCTVLGSALISLCNKYGISKMLSKSTT